MPKRDDDLLVSDMIDCCLKILNYIKGLDYDAFLNDSKTTDAVIRNFEVLGEACKYVSDETKLKNPLIEWRKIGDFRNILIHDYFGINHDILW
ncbi:MAG: HepT-like ribonuclease domain-containing protein, partial [Ginsengibacter sp.]